MRDCVYMTCVNVWRTDLIAETTNKRIEYNEYEAIFSVCLMRLGKCLKIINCSQWWGKLIDFECLKACYHAIILIQENTCRLKIGFPNVYTKAKAYQYYLKRVIDEMAFDSGFDFFLNKWLIKLKANPPSKLQMSIKLYPSTNKIKSRTKKA